MDTPIRLTAREVLELFYPAHGMHSVVDAHHATTQTVLECSCGTTNLKITTKAAKREKLTMAAVRNLLKNVPIKLKLPSKKAA